MALQKQIIPIDFTQGLDKKTDAKLTLPGKLTKLENCQFGDTNTITRAGEYTALTTSAISGAAIGTGKKVRSLRDQLVTLSSTGLHAVAKGGGSLSGGSVLKSSSFYTAPGLTVSDVYRNNQKQYDFDVAYSNNTTPMSVWVWLEYDPSASASRLYYAVIDESTGSPIVPGTLIGNSYQRPRVVWNSSSSVFEVYAIAVATTQVAHFRVTPSAPATVTSAGVISGTTNTFAGPSTSHLDAVYYAANNTIFLACHDNTGALDQVNFIKLSGSDGSTVVKSALAETVDLSTLTVIVMPGDSDGPYYTAIWGDSGTGDVNAHVCRLDKATPSFTIATVDTVTTPRRLSAVEDPTAATTKYWLFYEHGSATIDTTRRVSKALMNAAGTVNTAASVVVRGVGLATRAFTRGTHTYFGAALFDQTQSTVFVIDAAQLVNSEVGSTVTLNGPIIARVLPEEAGDYSGAVDTSGATTACNWAASDRIPAVLTDVGRTDNYVIPVLRRGTLRVLEGVDVTPSGIARAELDFAAVCQVVEYGDSLFFASACPNIFDGVSLVEAGFPYSPEVLPAPATAGGSIAAGTYLYTYCWEWMDANGRLWQSTPAVPKSVTLGGASRVAFTLKNQRLTRKVGAKFVLYRTEGSGSIFYRVAQEPGLGGQDLLRPLGAVWTDTTTYYDDTPDSALIQSQVLYTAGGVLENEGLPACKYLCVHQDRLFMAGLEDPYAYQYTEELRPGQPPNTSYVYRGAVPNTGGKITGIASMDDKLVIFCERKIWFVYGQGPNRLGQNDNYSQPQIADSGVGLDEGCPDSIALTPEGLWFKSPQGLRLLGRNMALVQGQDGRFLGSEVDSLADGCTQALLVPNKQQVRFYTGTIVLLWDFQWRQWSTLTNHAAVSACVWQELCVHMRSGGTLYKNTGTNHAGTDIAQTVETGWLKFAGVQGFQRVSELLLLGSFVETSNLYIYVGYDYADAYPVSTVTATSIGGATSAIPMQVRYRFSRQKCQAIRFKISTEDGGSMALSNFSLEVGVKRGGAKLSSTRSI